MTNYKQTDSGKNGKQFEITIHELLNRKNTNVRTAGRADERIAHKNYEIKTGAGELGLIDGKMVKGSSMVIYCPVVVTENDGTVDLRKQEAFILTRDNFLAVLDRCGLIRTKTATNGTEKRTIQTFWNNKENKPHGSKYFKLIDELYENCEMDFTEWLNERG